MAEYINRAELISNLKEFANEQLTQLIENLIQKQPTADVVEVRHARFEWGYQNGQYGIWCTDCGAGWVNSENDEWIAQEHKYCPNCGARMDEKE